MGFCVTNLSVFAGAGNFVNGDSNLRIRNFTVGQVPEPATLALFGLGLVAIGSQRSKRAA
jgi:hypothetical protein